ncbi:MAG TPA: response regulator [Firmicutes bacterium]|nr:response regulator [Bacillota bacterium]
MCKKGNILVVDDQSGIRMLLQEFFTQNGWAVSVASNGLKGLELIQEQHFDFAFIDMKMPVMDGVTFIEHMVKQKRQIPTILMTAFGEVELASKALGLGVIEVIPKPFDLNELLNRVEKHCICS